MFLLKFPLNGLEKQSIHRLLEKGQVSAAKAKVLYVKHSAARPNTLAAAWKDTLGEPIEAMLLGHEEPTQGVIRSRNQVRPANTRIEEYFRPKAGR